MASFAASASAADQNNFTLLSRAGKPIGKASYTIEKAKDGTYKIKSRFSYKLGSSASFMPSEDPSKPAPTAGMITEAEFTADYKAAEDGNFLTGFTQNSVTQMLTSFSPDKVRKTITIDQHQGGVGIGSRTLEAPKPDFALAPDYDPSAIQLLLTTSIAHPHADFIYLLLIPASGTGPKALNNFLYVTLKETGAGAGTLDGKPVTLKHFAVGYHSGKADLYTDEAGTLMQADMGTLAASYVRAKFVLTPQ
jgi:hypothetical protein